MLTLQDDAANYGITTPYTIPRVFLPTTTADFSTRPLPPSLTRKVARLNNRLRETLNQMQRYLLPLSAVRNQIVIIRAILHEMYEHIQPELIALGDQYSLETNARVQQTTLPHWDAHHLGGYIVYDAYFSIIRVPTLTPQQLLCQCIATTYALLGDLPYTMLAREEIEVLFTALYKMFRTFLEGEQDDPPPVPPAYVMHEHKNFEATELLWATLATDNSQRKNIAMFRWLIGHHMFNTITTFLTVAVENAVKAIEAGDDETAAHELDQAATFLRAGIACEWYAANFSSDIYSQIVRPSMSQQDVPGGDGFSGDQNAEFNRFKHAKELLKGAVRKATLSPRVEAALRHFVEMYVQDGEHHVLLASAMTGSAPSIAQTKWSEDLPTGTPAQSAVDFLRNMVMSRRAEFSAPSADAPEPILIPAEPMTVRDREVVVGHVDDLADTNLILREVEGQNYLIGVTGGQYWAVSAQCTHKEFPISTVPDESGCLVCTKHGAQFEPISGQKIRGPQGTTDLPRFAVVNDGGVLKMRV